MPYNAPYSNIGTPLILPQSCHLLSVYLADLSRTSYPYSPAATYLTPPGVTLLQPERKPLGTGTWKTPSGGQCTPGDYHLLQSATMYVFKTRQVHIPTSGTKQASSLRSVNLTNMLYVSMDPVESPFATASSWGDMSLSKHHNLDALSTMTSDTSLRCLPSPRPHPPCGQQPACPLLQPPISPLRNPPLATLNQQSTLHLVLSLTHHHHQRPLWSPLSLSPLHHPLLRAHWPWHLPLRNSNPPRQHWHWGDSWTTTRKALKKHEHWTIDLKHWTMNRDPWTFASLLPSRYVVLSVFIAFFVLSSPTNKTTKDLGGDRA